MNAQELNKKLDEIEQRLDKLEIDLNLALEDAFDSHKKYYDYKPAQSKTHENNRHHSKSFK